jgi:hypothetical protein
VNTVTTGDQVLPSVGMNGKGTFAVAWQGANPGGSGNGIFAQLYGPV